MKFIRYSYKNQINIGVMKADRVLSFKALGLDFTDLYDFIKNHREEDLNIIQKSDFSNGIDLDKVYLLAPFESTIHDIMCIGLNYQDHKDESSEFLTEDEINAQLPIYFPKRAIKINGPYDHIQSQLDLDPTMDYECELALIIGKEGKDIAEEDAMDYVFGYSIINDLSSRKTQRAYGQWYKGKSFDGYTVLGPSIVHHTQIEDPQDLYIKTWINGELRQDSNTKYMIRDIKKLISELSRGMTLVPGDIIATGTPEGVGQGFSPERWLKSGDLIEMEIEDIGRLENRVI